MNFDSLDRLPSRIKVVGNVASRYPDHERPSSWDERVAGSDVVLDSESRRIHLLSDGGQSPPKPGWEILVTGGSVQSGYSWTLYSIPHKGESEFQS